MKQANKEKSMRFTLFFTLLILAIGLSGCDNFEMQETEAPPAVPLPAGFRSDGNRGITVEGNVAMGVPVLSVSSNTTLTAAQMKGYRVSLTGDGTVLTIADSDCSSQEYCESPETTCDDSFDNDGDGYVDCLSGIEEWTDCSCAVPEAGNQPLISGGISQ